MCLVYLLEVGSERCTGSVCQLASHGEALSPRSRGNVRQATGVAAGQSWHCSPRTRQLFGWLFLI